MVLIFASAPKAYFHDLLADHKDVVTCCHPETASPCVHQEAFNCHYDHVVVTAPFLFQKNGFTLTKPVLHATESVAFIAKGAASATAHIKGRAPPAV